MELICDYRSAVLKKLEKAVLGRDKRLVTDIAKKTLNLGFEALELSLPGQCQDEPEALSWAVSAVQERVPINFMINTSNPESMAAVLRVHKGPAWIYGITCDREQMESVFPLAAKTGARVVGQIIRERGVPESFDECLSLATDFVVGSREFGMKPYQLFLDPIVLSVSSGEEKPGNVLKLLGLLKKLPNSDVQTAFRLSALGEGMPNKKKVLIEEIYLAMAMHEGLDAVIFDPYDERLVECTKIVEFFQNKRLSIESGLKN